MTMHQPGRHAPGGQAIPLVLLATLGAVGIMAGIMFLLYLLQRPGAPAASHEAGLVPAPAALRTAAAPLPAAPAPSAGVGRPLPMPPQGHQASARRAANGHFFFDVSVDGITVHTMFDTGASGVFLRAEDAARVGIAVNGLTYDIPIGTANGTSYAAAVTLDTLKVGDITVHNVPALVSRFGKTDTTLLGQSFMSKLEGYRLDGDELILQGH